MRWGVKIKNRIGLVAFIIALVTGDAAGAARYGDEPKTAKLDVVVDKPIFEGICHVLRFNDEQQQIATRLFESYWQKIQELQQQAHQRMQEVGEREIEEALAQRDAEVAAEPDARKKEAIMRAPGGPLAELIAAKKIQMHAVRAQACRDAEVLLLEFYEPLRALSGLDEVRFSFIPRYIRRQNLLTNEKVSFRGDFHIPVNVFDVVDQAARDEQPLAGLRLPEHGSLRYMAFGATGEQSASLKPEIQKGRAELQRILEEYDLALDAAFQAELAEDRAPIKRDKPSSVSSDDPEYAQHMRDLGKRWARRHDPAWNAIKQITQLLAAQGPQATADQWQDQTNRLLCPKLTAPRWPAGIREWLKTRSDITPEQTVALQFVLDEYETRRRALETQAIESGRIVKRVRYVINFQQEFPEDIEFARKKLEIHRLNIDAYKQLRSVLSSSDGMVLDERVFGETPDKYDPMRFGPAIDWGVLTKLEMVDFYNGAWRRNSAEIQSKETSK